MYVHTIPNRKSRPAILIREAYRENGKVKSRTIASVSDWPEAEVEALRLALKGESLVPTEGGVSIKKSPHGHVAAALGVLKQLSVDRMMHPSRSRERSLVVALIGQLATIFPNLSNFSTPDLGFMLP